MTISNIKIYGLFDAIKNIRLSYNSESDSTTANSESTMHTITKRELTQNDFEGEVPPEIIKYLNRLILWHNKELEGADKLKLFRMIKNGIPEGFLQERYVTLNYEVLRTMYYQRKKHNYTLCGEDLRHFIKVCNVLAETIEIQGKIDELTRGWV